MCQLRFLMKCHISLPLDVVYFLEKTNMASKSKASHVAVDKNQTSLQIRDRKCTHPNYILVVGYIRILCVLGKCKEKGK